MFVNICLFLFINTYISVLIVYNCIILSLKLTNSSMTNSDWACVRHFVGALPLFILDFHRINAKETSGMKWANYCDLKTPLVLIVFMMTWFSCDNQFNWLTIEIF